MLGESGIGSAKARKGGILEFNLWYKKNSSTVACVCLFLVFAAMAAGVFFYGIPWLALDESSDDSSSQRRGRPGRGGYGKNGNNQQIIPDPANFCEAWRATGRCKKSGPRIKNQDKGCDAEILPVMAGFCDCKDGDGAQYKVDYDCEKGRANFMCKDVCKDAIRRRDMASKLAKAEASRQESPDEVEERRRQ